MADLRRLMKERTQSKRISHPNAKYTSSGQLLCSLCSVPVKSEVLWPSHLTSKIHRNNVRIAKEAEEAQSLQAGAGSESSHRGHKRAPDGLEIDDDPQDDEREGRPSGEESRAAGRVGDVKRQKLSQDDGALSTDAGPADSSLPPGFFDDATQQPEAAKPTSSDGRQINAKEVGQEDEDEEWAAFEAVLARPDEAVPEASTSSAIPAFSASATITGQEVMYDGQDGGEGEDAGAGDEEDVADEEQGGIPEETEEERREREEREELMERIET